MKSIEVIFQAFVYRRRNQDCLFCTEKTSTQCQNIQDIVCFKCVKLILAMHEVDANMCK